MLAPISAVIDRVIDCVIRVRNLHGDHGDGGVLERSVSAVRTETSTCSIESTPRMRLIEGI